MVLVDTSVWVRFLAGREPHASELDALLERDEALAHDLVEGELLIGDRGGRPRLLASYRQMTRVQTLSHGEVVELVRSRKLHGRGIGWVDAHMLASAIVARAPLWTADAPLAAIAEELDVGYEPSA
jgi:predicted nucleic acid-binding protein